MDKPVQALLLANDDKLWNAVEDGRKNLTIRIGKRSYDLGFGLICCHLRKRCVKINITSVEYKALENTSEEDRLESMGIANLYEYIAQMKEFGRKYENLEPDSEVTVIRWTPMNEM